VIITSSSDSAPDGFAACAPGSMIMAAVDVEWTKNYRVKNGNTPFCYSVVWLAVPESGTPVNLDGAEFSYTSAYVEDLAETQDLIASADTVLARILDQAGLVAGISCAAI
jgi:hypothetical protein